MIRVQVENDIVTVGGPVAGTVLWQSRKPHGRVVVKLGWRTVGRGNRDSGKVGEVESIFSESAQPTADNLAFSLDIPVDAPPSYDGEIVKILWSVDARLEVSADEDERVSVPIHVAL